ncbi:hypothetical protein H6P81_002095 [Aristolochia fimbriata]|uniref:Uncharacterized protein n=1 Tax=Aristolochia fimbriata TaxID=158543 RepID=A0AAV7FC18_ARIFI|nr:hypothetical protein H6P81_002095 [Aristolochia fimbriata]
MSHFSGSQFPISCLCSGLIIYLRASLLPPALILFVFENSYGEPDEGVERGRDAGDARARDGFGEGGEPESGSVVGFPFAYAGGGGHAYCGRRRGSGQGDPDDSLLFRSQHAAGGVSGTGQVALRFSSQIFCGCEWDRMWVRLTLAANVDGGEGDDGKPGTGSPLPRPPRPGAPLHRHRRSRSGGAARRQRKLACELEENLSHLHQILQPGGGRHRCLSSGHVPLHGPRPPLRLQYPTQVSLLINGHDKDRPAYIGGVWKLLESLDYYARTFVFVCLSVLYIILTCELVILYPYGGLLSILLISIVVSLSNKIFYFSN